MQYKQATFTVWPHRHHEVFPDLKTRGAWNHYWPWLEGKGCEYEYFRKVIAPTFMNLGYAVSITGLQKTTALFSYRHGPHF